MRTSTHNPTNQWAKNLGKEELPDSKYLPNNWEKTKEKQEKIALDPETKEKFNPETGERTHVKDRMEFIKKSTPFGETKKIASAKLQLLEGQIKEFIIEDTHGQKLMPCFIHGDYVNMTHVDHVESASVIKKRQEALVQKMNDEPEFAEFVLSLDGMESFFTEVDNEYYGTEFFYNYYFNAIDNLWLACEACNCKKSAKDPLNYLSTQWMYGSDFLNYLGTVKDEGILKKTETGEGLAQVAIRYFWERHDNRLRTTKTLLTDIVHPLQRESETVDSCKQEAKKTGRVQDNKRAKRKEIDLECQLAFIKQFTEPNKKIKCPKGDEESPTKSDGEKDYVQLSEKAKKLSVPAERFLKIFEECTARSLIYFQEDLARELNKEQEGKIEEKGQNVSSNTNSLFKNKGEKCSENTENQQQTQEAKIQTVTQMN